MRVAVKVDSVSTQAFLPKVASELKLKLRIEESDGRVSLVVCDDDFQNYRSARTAKDALVRKLKYHGGRIEDVLVCPLGGQTFMPLDEYVGALEMCLMQVTLPGGRVGLDEVNEAPRT